MYKKFLKRLLDILFALLISPFGLIILFLLFPVVKLNSKGPFIYKSERIGKNEKPFKMYKIRTMKLGAKDIRNEDGSTFSSSKDSRITTVGKFLRKTSLDEIPQIFNVLFGQMSFIGPRPDLYSQIEYYSNGQFDRKKFNVKPGISGYAQVKGRNIITWEEKNKLDLFYVENLRFLLDVKIFFLTIFKIFKREGINRDV